MGKCKTYDEIRKEAKEHLGRDLQDCEIADAKRTLGHPMRKNRNGSTCKPASEEVVNVVKKIIGVYSD
ncbi:MAG: hypothetical protein HQL56_07915 [Magnetococcales bacterium]|nr:hypothetical protein [Magnetococcales bacterium]